MKLVLEHTKGPYQGVLQILGDSSQLLQEGETIADLPTLLGPMTRPPDETIHASLVGVKKSYILYRELIEPAVANKNFNPAQR